jgi:colicin import membrane protein
MSIFKTAALSLAITAFTSFSYAVKEEASYKPHPRAAAKMSKESYNASSKIVYVPVTEKHTKWKKSSTKVGGKTVKSSKKSSQFQRIQKQNNEESLLHNNKLVVPEAKASAKATPVKTEVNKKSAAKAAKAVLKRRKAEHKAKAKAAKIAAKAEAKRKVAAKKAAAKKIAADNRRAAAAKKATQKLKTTAAKTQKTAYNKVENDVLKFIKKEERKNKISPKNSVHNTLGRNYNYLQSQTEQVNVAKKYLENLATKGTAEKRKGVRELILASEISQDVKDKVLININKMTDADLTRFIQAGIDEINRKFNYLYL